MEVLRNNIGLNNGGKFTIYNSNQLTGSIQFFITTDGSTNFNELVKENQCYMVVGNLDPNTVKEIVDKVVNILKSQNYNNINPNITVLTQNDVEKQQSENLKNIVFQDDKLKVDVKLKEINIEKKINNQQVNGLTNETVITHSDTKSNDSPSENYEAIPNDSDERDDKKETANMLDNHYKIGFEPGLGLHTIGKPKTRIRQFRRYGTPGIASFALLVFLTVVSIAIGYFVFTIVR